MYEYSILFGLQLQLAPGAVEVCPLSLDLDTDAQVPAGCLTQAHLYCMQGALPVYI